jgi:hypothetical protein
MPTEHVDGASFAVQIERVFHDGPPTAVRQPPDDQFHDAGMPLINEGGQLRSAPARIQSEGDLEGGGHPTECSEAHLVQVAGFDSRHRLLTHTCRHRKVALSPAAPSSHRSKDDTDPNILHDPSMPCLDLRPLTCVLLRARSKRPVGCGPVGAGSVAMDPVAMDPVAMDPVAMDPVAMDPVAMDPVAMRPSSAGSQRHRQITARDPAAQCAHALR